MHFAHDLLKPKRTPDLADQVDLYYAKQLTIELEPISKFPIAVDPL